MKKLLYIFGLTFAVVSSSHAIDPFKSGCYVSIQGGGNYKTTQLTHNERLKSNLGWIASTAIGIRNKLNARYELEATYRHNTLSKYADQSISGQASTQAYMLNLVYDFPTRYFIKPYIGLGGGYTKQIINGKLKQPLENGSLHVNRHTNSFAWQAIGGISCPFDALEPLGYNIEGTIEYRFFNPRIKSSNDQSITLGLRTYFY